MKDLFLKYRYLLVLFCFVGLGAYIPGIIDWISFNKSIYIAYRDDGVRGSGTKENPFDGSTDAKLEAILSNAPINQTIFLYPSTNYTLPMTTGNGAPGWRPKNGQSIIGIGGRDSVKITASTNSTLGVSKITLVGSDQVVNNFSLIGIELDANADRIARQYATNGGTARGAGLSIQMYGENIAIIDCRIRNTWGGFTATAPNGSEGFPIFLGSPIDIFTNVNQETARFYTGHRLIGTEIIKTNELITDPLNYDTQLVIGGFGYCGPWGEIAYDSNKHNLGWSISENNLLKSTPTGPTLRWALSSRMIIRNNRIEHGNIGYCDTWGQSDIVIENNNVIGSRTAPEIIDIVLNTNSINMSGPSVIDSRFERAKDFIIRNNQFHFGNQRPSSNDNYYTPDSNPNVPDLNRSSTALIRVYAGYTTNPHTGGFIGASNWVIEGNSFSGTFTNNSSTGLPSYGTGMSAVWGQFKNSKISGNSFDGFNSAFYGANIVENFKFDNNNLSRVWAGLFMLSPTGLIQKNNIEVKNNYSKNLGLALWVGPSDNLTIEGNTIIDYGLDYIAIGQAYNVYGIAAITNDYWLGTGFPGRLMTNVTIQNNTFLQNGTNAANSSYSILIGGVNNYKIANNPHNSISGVAIGSHDSGSGLETMAGLKQHGYDVLWQTTNNHTSPALPVNPTNIIGSLKVDFGGTNGYIYIFKAP